MSVDWFRSKGSKVGRNGVASKSSHVTTSTATWRSRYFISVITKSRPTVRESMRQCLGPVERMGAGGCAEAIFLLVASRLPVGTRACSGMEHVRPGTRLCHAGERSEEMGQRGPLKRRSATNASLYAAEGWAGRY